MDPIISIPQTMIRMSDDEDIARGEDPREVRRKSLLPYPESIEDLTTSSGDDPVMTRRGRNLLIGGGLLVVAAWGFLVGDIIGSKSTENKAALGFGKETRTITRNIPRFTGKDAHIPETFYHDPFSQGRFGDGRTYLTINGKPAGDYTGK